MCLFIYFNVRNMNIFMVYLEGASWEAEGQMPRVVDQTNSKRGTKGEQCHQSKD